MRHSYRHEALLYRGVEGFLGSVVPFVREGVARREPVMVAVTGERLAGLRTALGDTADEVLFADMAVLGRNPAMIIPSWLEFIAVHSADGSTPVRGVGEPVWAGRTPAEIEECQLHEGLLNVAVGPDTPLWLICPYDVDALPPPVVDEAHRSHPIIVDSDAYRGSTEYGGAFHVGELFQDCLPQPMGPTRETSFDSTDVRQVEGLVERAALDVGVPLQKAAELADAVQQLALDSVRSGGGHGVLRCWASGTTLFCDVEDDGVGTDPLEGRSPTVADARRSGLWSANRRCYLTQVRSNSGGTQVRVHTRIEDEGSRAVVQAPSGCWPGAATPRSPGAGATPESRSGTDD